MLYFITSNSGKFREVSGIIPTVKQLNLDLEEIQSLDPKVVVEHKLTQAASSHAGSFLVEDTSLELTCLKGLPGTLIKFFEETLGVDGIAALAMKYEDRTAKARSTIGFRSETGAIKYFEGTIEGRIVPPRGSLNNFGWNSIFEPLGHDRTFAEMTVEEKNHISMRGLAAKKLLSHLSA